MADIVVKIKVGPGYAADLKRRLEEYGITPAELARESGYNRHMLSRTFRTGMTPTIRNIEKLEAGIVTIRRRRAEQERAEKRLNANMPQVTLQIEVGQGPDTSPAERPVGQEPAHERRDV